MRRTVSAAMDLDVTSASDLVLAVSVARLPGLTVEEQLRVELDGEALEVAELTESTGTRLHLAHAGVGAVTVRYDAVVEGRADAYLHDGGQYEWDNCAPPAVAVAAGLHASRIDGSELRYNCEDVSLPDLLICRRELAEQALAAVRPMIQIG